MDYYDSGNLNFIYDLYRNMVRDGLSYVYRGDFSAELTTNILSLTESNIENSLPSTSVKKKVYFIMVESLQNITRHQDNYLHESSSDSDFFAARQLHDDFFITSGNTIENKHIPSLKEKIEKINSLDKESLKAYSQQVLNSTSFSEKGGVGLGLLEMARKSGNKLAYEFVEINEKFSYFYFQVKVSGGSETVEKIKFDYFDEIKRLHHFIIDKSINIIYQGEFTHENVNNLISMIETNIGNDDEFQKRKKVLNIIVELLQNIYKHADELGDSKEEKPGIFLMGKKNGNYFISSSNIVHNSKAEFLKTRVEKVNNLNFDELDLSINVALMKEVPDSPKAGAGLGLMDMKLKSRHNLGFDIKPMNEDHSFFSIKVTV